MRQANEQITELTRTINDQSRIVKKTNEQVASLLKQIELTDQERDKASNEIIELQSDIDTLDAQLEAEKKNRLQDSALHQKLQEELDELRAHLQEKTSEETRRNEVHKSKEKELADLRQQVAQMHDEQNEIRRSALEIQGKLKLELEYATREHNSLKSSHNSLLDRERATQAQLVKSQAALTDLEKGKRAMESEVDMLRSRQHDSESRLAEALRGKEVRCMFVKKELLTQRTKGVGAPAGCSSSQVSRLRRCCSPDTA